MQEFWIEWLKKEFSQSKVMEKLYKVLSGATLTFILCALIFDGVMIYAHFFNEKLNNTIINNIDKVIY